MNWLIAIPVAFLLLVLVILLFRAVKYRGVTGALFKSRVTRTLGSIDVLNTSAPKLRIKVHALQKSEPGWVGIEFERFNGDAWQVTPLTLSRSEAEQLSHLLISAVQIA